MRAGIGSLGLVILSAAIGCGNNTNNGNGTVQFTASGEVLALGGYAFPPANAGDPDFVDGWEVHFTKFIAVFDKVTLSANPDAVPQPERLPHAQTVHRSMASCGLEPCTLAERMSHLI